MYRFEGEGRLAELFGDRVVYRNLEPADPRLPSYGELREEMGLGGVVAPRKSEPAYGEVVAALLGRAQALERPGVAIERLVYIGDTRLNDGRAFGNLCRAGGWAGWAFIGRDALGEAPALTWEGSLCLANRWSLLPRFLCAVSGGYGRPPGEGTAVVVDLDKTAIGARGRNDGVIDGVRLEAVRCTVAGLLGDAFDLSRFQSAYEELNRPAYHAFTADNQDYLAYTCLLLGAGLFDLSDLADAIRRGELCAFADLVRRVDRRRSELVRRGLASIHDTVRECLQSGDPTPFKAFRRREYRVTAAHFGPLPEAPVEELLRRRIVITGEVRRAALWLRKQGALLFGISDKPDEASLPDGDQAAAGMLPLHRLPAAVVGSSPAVAGQTPTPTAARGPGSARRLRS